MVETYTKKRSKKPFLVFLLIVAIVLASLMIVPAIYTKTHKDVNTRDAKPLFMDFDKELNDKFMSEPSDIEGMTRRDKKAMGLAPDDGSDTDHDGLTDKEEIEVYKSDPLKASTAGDLYTDKEKIDAGLDLHTSATYEGTPPIPGNRYSAVTLTAKTADDRNAIIQDVSGLYETLYTDKSEKYAWVAKYTTYKSYEIGNFSGEISIDMTPVLEKHKGLKMEDFIVLLSTRGNYDDMNKTDFVVQGNSLIPDISKEERYTFLLVIANKHTKNIFKTMSANLDYMVNAINGEEVTECDATIVDYTLLSFFKSASTIYYVSSGSRAKDEQVLDKMFSAAAAIVDPAPTLDNIKEVTPERLKFIRKLLSIIPSARITPGFKDIHASNFLLSYFDYNDIKDLAVEGEKEEAEEGNRQITGDGSGSRQKFYSIEETTERGFIDKDYQYPDFLKTEVLPFRNFGTPGVTTGNCAGIAAYTQLLHDKGAVPLSGEYTFKDPAIGTREWNISKDPENRTLTDIGLHDYKDPDFARTIEEDRCTEAEKQFVNMINDYWASFNKTHGSAFETLTYNKGDNAPTASTIYRMMDVIDSGSILTFAASVYKKNETGIYTEKDYYGAHAVNLYDYQVLTDYERVSKIVVFKVYDSNAPRNNETNELVIEMPIAAENSDDVEITGYSYTPGAIGYTMTDQNVYDAERHYSFAVYGDDMKPLFTNDRFTSQL